jgi:hypothetical protein
MKKEILSWIPVIACIPVIFLVHQYAVNKEEQKAEREAEYQALQIEIQQRDKKIAEDIKEKLNQSKSNVCNTTYSEWSLCSPDNQQYRLVENLQDGCSIGETTRSCTYTYSPIYELSMDQVSELIVDDLKKRGGSFRYTSYDQATDGKYLNSFNLAVVPSTGSLAITRQTIIVESGQLLSDTILFDAYGDYKPDTFSAFGSPVITLTEVGSEVSAQYITMWEKIISHYFMIYYNDY